MLASVIANANRDPKKHRKPFEPKDFIPQRDKVAIQQEEQTWEEQAKILEMWARMFEAKDGGPK